MTAAVLHFTPRAELTPLTNIRSFIRLCQQSDVLQAREQFHKNKWSCGSLKGKNGKNTVRFTVHADTKRARSEAFLPSPFLEFAKAALVYLHDKTPVVDQSSRIAALRCLERALRERTKGSRPTAVTCEVLDDAVRIAGANNCARLAYQISGQLGRIAKLMEDKGFVHLRKAWEHGLQKPSEHGSRISPEALEARESKLPSEAALRAIGNIFQDAVEPCDVTVASNLALLLCAPDRVNEVVRLRRRCAVDGTGEFNGKFGLSWPGSKNFPDQVKWLPSEMVPIARQAVSNLSKVSSPARALAEWYTANPKQVYLHEDAKHLRSKTILTARDMGLLLWGDSKASNSAIYWATKTNSLEPLEIGGKRYGFAFADVEKAVLSMLPATFPYVPGDSRLLCKDALSLLRTNEMHGLRGTWLCMFNCVDSQQITLRIGKSHVASIFDKFGFKEDNGSRIELLSHSLRHYLNMLAHSGGLSSAEIAIFSGRKDIRQNRSYDHMTSAEVQAPISQALKEGFTSELEPATVRRRPVARRDFKSLKLRATHTTEYGWCEHDFASEPCPLHRDCINCDEQECIKGEATKEAHLRMLEEEIENSLVIAREALSNEEYNADAWVAHYEKTLERVKMLLAILTDAKVPNGARIRLTLVNLPVIRAGEAEEEIETPPEMKKLR